MVKSVYKSPLGGIHLMADGGALVYCNWDSEDCQDKETKLMAQLEEAGGDGLDKEVLEIARRQLDGYFSGNRLEFDLPLRLIGTEFQKRVWEAIREVGYGSVRTYKWLAERSGNGKGYQAVAGACGRNPLAIIVPCHRILSAGSGLGGYTGGIDRKESLLRLENRKGRD